MIKGRYVRGNQVTEVAISGPIIQPEEKKELHSFNWKSKPKGTHKRIEGISAPNAVVLGMACGLTCGSLLASFIAYADWPFRLLLIATLILDSFIVIENMTKEVEH